MVSSEDIENIYRNLRFDMLGYTGIHEREILSELLEESHNLYTRSGHAECLQVKRLLLDLSSEILQSVYIYDRSQLYKPHVDRLIKLLQAHRSSGVLAAQNLHQLINWGSLRTSSGTFTALYLSLCIIIAYNASNFSVTCSFPWFVVIYVRRYTPK